MIYHCMVRMGEVYGCLILPYVVVVKRTIGGGGA